MKELQDNILGIATKFSQVPEFNLPVKLDYRGIVYCIPEYFNYQSCDLAYLKVGIVWWNSYKLSSPRFR